jgi:hypothetical protein
VGHELTYGRQRYKLIVVGHELTYGRQRYKFIVVGHLFCQAPNQSTKGTTQQINTWSVCESF